MSEIEKQVEIIMAAPVSGLVELNDYQFGLVLALIHAARLSFVHTARLYRPIEVKREIKRKVKHGK